MCRCTAVKKHSTVFTKHCRKIRHFMVSSVCNRLCIYKIVYVKISCVCLSKVFLKVNINLNHNSEKINVFNRLQTKHFAVLTKHCRKIRNRIVSIVIYCAFKFIYVLYLELTCQNCICLCFQYRSKMFSKININLNHKEEKNVIVAEIFEIFKYFYLLCIYLSVVS